MWWNGDSWVSARIAVLSAARRDQQLPAITAVGSTWGPDGERTLFVGVHPSRDPRPWAWAPGGDARARFTRSVIRRYGPLPFPEQVSLDHGAVAPSEKTELDVAVREPVQAAAPFSRIGRALLALRRQRLETRMRLLILSLPEADEETREELARFELPAATRIGYVGPIRPRARKGYAVFRKWPAQQGTIGSLIRAEQGAFLTTAGHLGAGVGDFVYRRRLLFGRKPLGRVAAVTCPEFPDDPRSAVGVDVAAISPGEDPIDGDWQKVELGDSRRLQHGDYVCWNGGMTGPRNGSVTVLAQEARAIEGGDYEHVVLVLGNPPGYGGAAGDSGTGMYDAEGRLLGYFIGTEGGRSARGVAPAVWFQTIDAVHPYLEDRCGPVGEYLGDSSA
jgi:hypothetical protein